MELTTLYFVFIENGVEKMEYADVDADMTDEDIMDYYASFIHADNFVGIYRCISNWGVYNPVITRGELI